MAARGAEPIGLKMTWRMIVKEREALFRLADVLRPPLDESLPVLVRPRVSTQGLSDSVAVGGVAA
jgi:hypothetical protein